MTIDPVTPRPVPLRTLNQLASDVRTARRAVDACRLDPVVRGELHAAQLSWLGAMELFAGELGDRHLPVPPRLRDDLRLQRRLYGSLRAVRSGADPGLPGADLL